MTNFDSMLAARSAFEGIASTGGARRGVTVCDRDGLSLAIVLARKGQEAALAARVCERFGIELPRTPRRAVLNNVAFAGMGPGMWLATREPRGGDFSRLLADTIGDIASVVDQSSGFAVLRLSGPHIRDALCKFVPLDLHPKAFAVDDVATTVAAHIGVTIWRCADAADGVAVFEIAVGRSFAESFWRVVSSSAASSGLNGANG